MRVIARGTLRDFWKRYPQAEQTLKAWFQFVSKATWTNPHDVKRDYVTASFRKDNRVCFNIGGHNFRLIVRINYSYQIIYIRFVGTHKEYDRIDGDLI